MVSLGLTSYPEVLPLDNFTFYYSSILLMMVLKNFKNSQNAKVEKNKNQNKNKT